MSVGTRLLLWVTPLPAILALALGVFTIRTVETEMRAGLDARVRACASACAAFVQGPDLPSQTALAKLASVAERQTVRIQISNGAKTLVIPPGSETPAPGSPLWISHETAGASGIKITVGTSSLPVTFFALRATKFLAAAVLAAAAISAAAALLVRHLIAPPLKRVTVSAKISLDHLPPPPASRVSEVYALEETTRTLAHAAQSMLGEPGDDTGYHFSAPDDAHPSLFPTAVFDANGFECKIFSLATDAATGLGWHSPELKKIFLAIIPANLWAAHPIAAELEREAKNFAGPDEFSRAMARRHPGIKIEVIPYARIRPGALPLFDRHAPAALLELWRQECRDMAPDAARLVLKRIAPGSAGALLLATPPASATAPDGSGETS